MSALPVPPLHDEPPEEPVRLAEWKRVVAWIGAGLAILAVLLVVAVLVLLHSSRAHRYVLRAAQEKASAALGVQVQARDFALHFSGISPTLDLYDVVVHGAEPYSNPPLLAANHIRAGVRVVSLVSRKWYLNEFAVERPVLHVFVDKNGVSNLPKGKNSSQGHTDIFDLGVRHAQLDRGEAYYNNRKSVLNADLHDLSFQAGFEPGPRRYSGRLGYRDGHLQLENFSPLPHEFQASFSMTPEQFTLEQAMLRSGQSQVVLHARLDNYTQPHVEAKYDAVLDAGEFRRVLKNPSLPVGLIRVAGSLHYQSEPKRKMLDALTLDGDLASRSLRVQSASFQGEITDLGARYAIAQGNLLVRDMHARLLGGEMHGNLAMRDLSGASRSQLHSVLRGVSLAELKGQLRSPALRQVALGGAVNADTDATWGKTFGDLVARANADLKGIVAPSAGGGPAVPLQGVIHVRYAAASGQIGLQQSFLRTAQTFVTLDGVVSTHSSLQVRLQSNDLHELETVANALRTQAGQPAQPLSLAGRASFTGAVQGSTSAPQLTGQFTAANLRVKGSAWRLLRTNIAASPSLLSLRNGEAQPADRGHISFNISAGLRHWSFTQTSPIEVSLNASQLNAATLVQAAGSPLPIAGTLSANVSVRGSELNPVGQGTVSLTQGKISNEPIQSATLKFQGTGNEVHGNLGLHMPAGTAQSNFTYLPRQQGYQVDLQAIGLRLDQLRTLQARNLQVSGVLNVRASGQGTLQDPQLTASVQAPKITVRDQSLNGLTFNANIGNHVANLALDSQAVNSFVRARATVNLTGDYEANATVDTQPIPLQPILSAYAPAQAANITGQTELHAALKGPLKDKTRLEAHATIPTLEVSYKNAVRIGAASPIRFDYTNGVLALQRATIRGTDTNLEIQGSIPVRSTAPMSLLLQGTVNLQLAQLFSPDITSSGQVRFNINSFGARANPNVQGQIEIINASVATGSAPIGLQNGNGMLTLTKDRLEVTRFQGTVGGGRLSASGAVVYRPAVRFDLALAGEGIRMLYPESVRENFDNKLTLTGTPNAATLNGEVRLNQLSFARDFDLAEFISQMSGETTPPPAQGFSQNLQLNLTVQSTSRINVVSRELSLQGVANLEVRGTAAEPVMLGRINLTSGDLIFRGNRYILQGGTIDFINPSRTQPVINVSVSTTSQQYEIQLQFQGPIDQLHTNYSSNPALPASDIINLLAFGKTTEAAAANPAPPGNLGAQSLVASQVASQVTSRVEKIAGISQLSVDPVLGGGGSEKNPGARITLQQRVTSNLFVTFATDVTSTQRQVIQLEYKVSPRVSVSATRDQNGGFGFDTRIHKTW